MENGNNTLWGRTILLVNTGSLKKKFILQKLKKMGLTLVVLNKEKNWAQPYVDHWILSDISDHSESISNLKSFINNNPNVKINGVLTFWEDDVLLTSKIVDRFKFVGIPFNVAKKARNKYLFREFCQENGISAPRYKLIRSMEDINYVCENFNFPLVIKPTYGSGSVYVVKVENKSELIETFNYIKNNISINTESALADGLDILVEEYIDGDEVDIDILLQNGKIKFFSISDNFDKLKQSFFIDNGQAIPSSLPEKKQKELIELAEVTLEKMGVQNGCIHFESKSTKNGPVPIEVNLRMGGDYVYSYIKETWDIDLIEYAIKIAVGQYIKIEKREPHKYIIGWDLHPDDSGILVESGVNDELKRKNYFKEIHFYKQIGDPVLVPPEGYDYLIGWLTVSGENLLDAQDNLRDALDHINYRVVKFDPDSSLGKTSRKNRFSVAVLNKDLLIRAAKIEKVKRISRDNLRNLHIGIVGNTYNENQDDFERELTSAGKLVEKTLSERGYKVTFFDFNNLAQTLVELQKNDVDLFFNVCERINNSNLMKPHAAAILDSLQIPYTGSNPLTLDLCIDKITVKKLLSYHNIPTPKWDYAYTLDDEISEALRYPLIVKPGNADNSIGIMNESVVTNKEELQKQLKKMIVDFGRPALVEEYIEGDEYDVSILGNDESDLRVLPLSRSIFKNLPSGYWHIYTYEAKWQDNPIYKNIIIQRPLKNISKKLETLITEIALDTYNLLGCRDYGRVEIRVDEDDNPYVLELNSNPSLTVNACLPSAANLIDMNYGDLLEEIIEMAIKRYQKNNPSSNLQY